MLLTVFNRKVNGHVVNIHRYSPKLLDLKTGYIRLKDTVGWINTNFLLVNQRQSARHIVFDRSHAQVEEILQVLEGMQRDLRL